MPKLIPPDKYPEHFWSMVRRGDTDSCWEWQRGKGSSGYGSVCFRGKPWAAHRVAWILTNGEIPSGKQVLHHCDNPACCNPAHLYAGTIKQNATDRMRRRRANPQRGTTHYNCRLTPDDVRAIRRLAADGVTYAEIGRKFGVTYVHAVHIHKRIKWKHLPD